MNFLEYCKELEQDIQKAYEESVTIEEAERLAAKFLGAQMKIAEILKPADLDARMRKRGVKAIRAAVRMEEIKKHEKKPTESYLEDVLNLSELVTSEEQSYDEAEVDKEQLKNYLDIFREAHIYFRGISKGRLE